MSGVVDVKETALCLIWAKGTSVYYDVLNNFELLQGSDFVKQDNSHESEAVKFIVRLSSW